MKKSIAIFLFMFSVSFQYAQTTLTEALDFTAMDVDGKEWNLFELLKTVQISAAQTRLNVLDIKPGFYLLSLSGNTVSYRVKRFLVSK